MNRTLTTLRARIALPIALLLLGAVLAVSTTPASAQSAPKPAQERPKVGAPGSHDSPEKAASAAAPPAHERGPRGALVSPAPFTTTQPDGTSITLQRRGDGARHWTQTSGGQAVVQDSDGWWSYAGGTDAQGQLTSSGIHVGPTARPPAAAKGLQPTEDTPATPGRPNMAPAVGQPSAATAAPGVPHVGTAKTLVILAAFTDYPGTTTASSWASRYFGGSNSLRDFYHQASYNKLDFAPAAETDGTTNDGVVGWVSLGVAHPDLHDTQNSDSRPTIRSAILAANSKVNFASYDTNADGRVDPDELHVSVVMAGFESSTGTICGTGVWGHRWGLDTAAVVDGVSVGSGGFTTFGERICDGGTNPQNTIGIIAHEMGHDLGMPDLYQTDYEDIGGVGNWSLMSYGSHNSNGGIDGSSPALPDAFMRSSQGWVTPTVATTGNLSVATAATTADVEQLGANTDGMDWGDGNGSGEYFLVENRQKVGYDAGLPGCGLLIWHIDESRFGNDFPPRLVQLVQADGLAQLDSFASYGDGGDPYPGTAVNTALSHTSTPSSDLYSGLGSGVSATIPNAACAATMNLSVTITAPETPQAPANDALANAWVITPDTTAFGMSVAATHETNEVVHAANEGGASVWWKVTPASSGSLTVDTHASSFDTLLAVYTGTSPTFGNLFNVASNDDLHDGEDSQLTSEVRFNVTSGKTYYIAVDGFGGASGEVGLHVSAIGAALVPPSNDAFAAAAGLPLLSNVFTPQDGSTFGGTRQSGEPSHAGIIGGASSWWKFTPSSPGTLELDTAASGFDTALAVYTGAAVNTLTAVPGASNDDDDSGEETLLTSRVAPFAVNAGTTYYVAVDGFGGATGQVRLNATYIASTPGSYVPLPAARILDTRNGTGGISGRVGQTKVDLTVVGVGGVPASGVAAVVLNLAEVGGTGTQDSWVTAWPTGSANPGTANLNYAPGKTVSNLVIVKVGTGGKISLNVARGTTHLVADVQGWFPTTGYNALTPARILDTRNGTGGSSGPVGQTKIDLTVVGVGGVPAGGVGAVVLNLAEVGGTGTQDSWVTAWPTGTANPGTANLNYKPGKTVSNLVIVKVGTGGKISLNVARGTTHLVADVQGWFPTTGYTALNPARVLDTRNGTGGSSGPVGLTRIDLTVLGVGGVPASGVKAVVLNLAEVGGTGTQDSWVTVWACCGTNPGTANLNYTPGTTVSNLVIVPVGTNGKISLSVARGTTHLVADVQGYVGV